MGASARSACAAAEVSEERDARQAMPATRFGGGNCRLCGREYILGNVYANQAKALAEPAAAAATAAAAVAEAGTNELTNRTQHSTGCG